MVLPNQRRVRENGVVVPRLPGLLAWWDFSDLSTITKDGSNLVSAVTDKSNNSNGLLQATGAKQPTWTAANKNGLDVLDFDGGDALTVPSGIYSLANGDWTSFFVVIQDAGANERLMTLAIAGNASRLVIRYAGAGNAVVIQNNATGTVPSASATVTNWNIVTARHADATTQGIAVNNGTEATDANGANIGSIVAGAIGADGAAGASFFNGKMAEILIYNRSLSVAERTSIAAYLSLKWGITI